LYAESHFFPYPTRIPAKISGVTFGLDPCSSGTGRYSDSRCSEDRCSDSRYSDNRCSDKVRAVT